jgi:hypothetical protein
VFDKIRRTLILCPQGKAGSYTIPNSVTNIGDWAFYLCTSLTNVAIPNSVNSIGDAAFIYCISLTSVTIPESVAIIGNDAVFGCSSVTAITVDPGNPSYSSLDGVLFDKSQNTLIQYPEAKTGSYTIPSTVANIGYDAFGYCTTLTSVTIPNGVTNIGDGAFEYFFSLTSVTIGNRVASIGDHAFDTCTSLTNVTIPKSVTSIGDGAFSRCTSLTNVTIPNSVTNIGDWAFGGCFSLTNVYFGGNAPSVGSDVFSGDNYATVYYLPGTTGWDQFSAATGLSTAFWFLPKPLILNFAPSFGVQSNRFGFLISWATNVLVVVEASTTLGTPTWSPISTNTLTAGSSYFSDSQWTNHSRRFYRLRMQ